MLCFLNFVLRSLKSKPYQGLEGKPVPVAGSSPSDGILLKRSAASAASKLVETHPVRAGCEPRRNRYRVFLVCNELGMPSVAIYSEQNRQHMHRQKADESYIDSKGLAPVEVCNTFQKLSGCARRTTSTTCTLVKGHIGPSPKVVQQMGDKVAARKAAIEAGVLILPETDGPVIIKVEVLVFCKKHGFPVIFKAASSGKVGDNFERGSSEAKASVGNGAMLIGRFIERPRHIELQLLDDKAGNVDHLYERDGPVERRHQ
ncbi:pyruvate carboxylase [Culex quinquefasciatus]|uniref:Pyruvate carboxylase n=1 Tax=Culex quinquefasciatus TaxID=7176 RepID=B0WZZ9_CULQU|nr:pyruvate carboxylase [Culex quinquefasciatus]|eukprot:XP_001862971.1 pyruvate carboxylase [Culex quinquefasciatus]